MYVVDHAADKVFYYELNRQFGNTTFTNESEYDYLLHEENADPTGLWLTGWLMYVADDEDDKVYAYEMGKETVRMPQYDIDDLDRVGNSDPAGITSDWRWVYVLDSVDKAIYAYEYPQTPYKTVNIEGSSEITVPENSTTTGAMFNARDPNPDLNTGATNTLASIGLFRTQTDDRIFELVRHDNDTESRLDDNFELVFRVSPRGYYEDPNYEDPKDSDPPDNVYDLIITGGSGASRTRTSR